MQSRALMAALVVTIAMAGCATWQTSTDANLRVLDQERPCPGACAVNVWVEDTGKGPVVRVDAQRVRMIAGDREVVVAWRLKAEGYEFRADSITPFTGASRDGKEATTARAWDGQLSRLLVRDSLVIYGNRNSSKDTLYYNVKVYPKDGKAPLVLDPSIYNDP